MVKTSKSELIPGLMIAPGYFMHFWEKEIIGKFSHEVMMTNAFKPYRELWVGALLAAFYNKYFEGLFYIEMPNSEPPDVNLIRLRETISPGGRKGYGYERLGVEITRCNFDSGESLEGQIEKKNTKANQNLALAVYLFGPGRSINFKAIYKVLQERDMHPSEVKIVCKVETPIGESGPVNLFIIANVYPELSVSTVDMADKEAFVDSPAILKVGNKAYNQVLRSEGSFRLLPPKLNKSDKRSGD